MNPSFLTKVEKLSTYERRPTVKRECATHPVQGPWEGDYQH